MIEGVGEQVGAVGHDVEQLADRALWLGQLVARFAREERAPRLPDGRCESDVEHSFHLAMAAPELAMEYEPDLDCLLVTAFAIIHDLVEVYTGDVWTYSITPEARAAKDAAEAEAIERLAAELSLFWADLLLRYKAQVEPEARFVRLVDKIMPTVVNTNDDLATATFLTDHNVTSVEVSRQHQQEKLADLKAEYPEFPEIFELFEELEERRNQHYFPDSAQAL